MFLKGRGLSEPEGRVPQPRKEHPVRVPFRKPLSGDGSYARRRSLRSPSPSRRTSPRTGSSSDNARPSQAGSPRSSCRHSPAAAPGVPRPPRPRRRRCRRGCLPRAPGGGREHCVLVAHLLNGVDQRQVEHLGHEARADALDLVRRRCERLAGEVLGQHRAGGGLHRHRLDVLAAHALDVARDAGDGAAGADTGDQDVDAAVGVVPDLGAGGGLVDRRVGGGSRTAAAARGGRDQLSTISFALAIAPFMPLAPSVSTSFAP